MMVPRRYRRTPVLYPTLATILLVCALGSGRAAAQFIITEIIDAAGDGAGNGLSVPWGIAVDAAGNAYVAGFASSNAFKITPAGVITEIIDCTGDGTGNCTDFTGNFLNRPEGIAVDVAGNAYVAGFGTDNAFKITPAGVITQIIDATGDGAGNTLSEAVGIAVDAAGNAYVAGRFSDNAFKITPGGVITEIIDAAGVGGSSNLRFPLGIAVDGAGNAYVTGGDSFNAFKITPTGIITEIIDRDGDGAGNGLRFPWGIAVDNADNVYVTGIGSDNAFKITPIGIITQIIDTTGGGGSSSLRFPIGIAVDAVGNAYVVGRNSDNVFKIMPDCNNNGVPDTTDITNGTSPDCNANGVPDECEAVVLDLGLDIKPGGCPNVFNRNSHGVLPVALLGGADFDVTTVDVSSVRLLRADGVGGAVAPNEGPPGPHSVFEDVATPFAGQTCDCLDLAGDGILDLSMKFRTDAVVAALGLNDLPAGALVELVLRGCLLDGTAFSAGDCLRLVPPGTASVTLAVQSDAAGAWIDVGPLDNTLDGGGFADFQRNYFQGTVVTLTVPRFAGDRLFTGWLIDGAAPGAPGERSIDLTVSGETSALAEYVDLAPGDVNRDGTVDGGDIQAFVDILVAPAGADDLDSILADLNGDNQVDLADMTQFVQMLLGPA